MAYVGHVEIYIVINFTIPSPKPKWFEMMSTPLIESTSHQRLSRFPPTRASTSKNLGTCLRSAVEPGTWFITSPLFNCHQRGGYLVVWCMSSFVSYSWWFICAPNLLQIHLCVGPCCAAIYWCVTDYILVSWLTVCIMDYVPCYCS